MNHDILNDELLFNVIGGAHGDGTGGGSGGGKGDGSGHGDGLGWLRNLIHSIFG